MDNIKQNSINNDKDKDGDIVKAIKIQIDSLNNKFKIYDKVINSDSNKGINNFL